MEQSVVELILESLPVTSKILLVAVISAFAVYWFMKFYARFEKTEATVVRLDTWTRKADEQIHAVELRLTKVEVRIENLEMKVDEIKEEFEKRFDKIDERFDKIDKRFDRMEEKFDKKFDTIIEILAAKRENSGSLTVFTRT